MREIMRRIAELRSFRYRIITASHINDDWQAQVDWLDMTIAEHEADLDALCKDAA